MKENKTFYVSVKHINSDETVINRANVSVEDVRKYRSMYTRSTVFDMVMMPMSSAPEVGKEFGYLPSAKIAPMSEIGYNFI